MEFYIYILGGVFMIGVLSQNENEAKLSSSQKVIFWSLGTIFWPFFLGVIFGEQRYKK